MADFLRATFALLMPVFVVMAVLVKLTHAVMTRRRGMNANTVWIAALAPGAVCTVAALVLGSWPVAVDCVLSAVALGLLGKRYAPPPRFEV